MEAGGKPEAVGKGEVGAWAARGEGRVWSVAAEMWRRARCRVASGGWWGLWRAVDGGGYGWSESWLGVAGDGFGTG